jgi:hypothetical protein
VTLIAVASYGDHAEILTDTFSYTANLEGLGRVTKVLALHHLDAVIAVSGASGFGNDVKAAALMYAPDSSNALDALLGILQPLALSIWKDRTTDPHEYAHVVVVGWDSDDRCFRSYVLASERDFEPEPASGLWMQPTPWTMRPSQLELERVARLKGADESQITWATQPSASKPLTVSDWVHLGRMAREQRALATYARVLVAGDLILTRLERGAVSSKVVHRFHDETEDSDEFRQMVRWSWHPVAQMESCWCDSGHRFIDCHLVPYLDTPCGCRSGQTFRVCHAVL